MNSKRKRIFTAEEIEYIKRVYPTGTCDEIGDHLGVSRTLIGRAARAMGLKKADGWSPALYANRYVRHYKHNEHKVHNAL